MLQAIWYELGLGQILLIAALFVCIDARIGLSAYIAYLFRNKRSEDFVLVLLTAAISLVGCRLLNQASPSPPIETLVQYIDTDSLKAAMARAHARAIQFESASRYATAFITAILCSGAICAALALRFNRPMRVWILLSFLSNWGGIIWLLARRKDALQADVTG